MRYENCVTDVGDIKSGLPPFELPPFSLNRTEGNITVLIGFSDICSELGASIGLIPLIAILEQVAIAKAFGTSNVCDLSSCYFRRLQCPFAHSQWAAN